MYWILACIILLCVLIFSYLQKSLDYWPLKGVPHRPTSAMIMILIRTVFQLQPQAEILKDFYDEFSQRRYFAGLQFFKPALFVRDPDLIKQITVKDFDHFVNHNAILPKDVEPLMGKSLFALTGDRWRDMRATLSPSFTSSKMKSMFVLMDECARQFVNYYKERPNTKLIDMKDATTRYANDVIATTAFGINCDSLREPNNHFYLMGKKATTLRGFLFNVKMFVMMGAPSLAKLFGIRLFSLEVGQFFRTLVKTNIESREKTGVVRPDMIHLLMEAKNGRLNHEDHSETLDTGFAVIEESSIDKETKRQKPPLSDDDLTAQVLIFFFAGFETISILLCFLIYELAVNTDVQERLRIEVDETLENGGGSLSYERLLKMKYLDMVVSETLRKWPAAVVTDRVCNKPFTIQPEKEDGVPVHIEENDIVILPVYGIHRDPKFYPDPERFDPERFSDERKSEIHPYTFTPFGVGPRSCIGNRFALLETKTLMFHILANFEIHVTENTRVPLRLAKNQINLSSEDGFWFGLKLRKQ